MSDRGLIATAQRKGCTEIQKLPDRRRSWLAESVQTFYLLRSSETVLDMMEMCPRVLLVLLRLRISRYILRPLPRRVNLLVSSSLEGLKGNSSVVAVLMPYRRLIQRDWTLFLENCTREAMASAAKGDET